MAFQDLDMSLLRCGQAKKCQGDRRTRRQISSHRCRVSSKLLRIAVPDKDDVSEAESALLALAALCEPTWEKSGEEDHEDDQCNSEKSEYSCSKGWKALLDRIELNHAWQVRRDLGVDVLLEPVYPDAAVQKQFLEARKDLDHNLLVTYHGTKAHNIAPIKQNGLLVPGHGGVRVANGSAHGVGIYTAKLGSANLSKGFCDSGTMFLCAVCDTSVCDTSNADVEKFVPSMTHVQTSFPKRFVFQGRTFGNFRVEQESKEVRHVGDAVVVFHENCVVPVFTATISQGAGHVNQTVHFRSTEDEWCCGPVRIGSRQVIVPTRTDGLIKFGSHVGAGRSGKKIWVPVMPKKDVTAHERSLQRRLNRKGWRQTLRYERRTKLDDATELANASFSMASET